MPSYTSKFRGYSSIGTSFLNPVLYDLALAKQDLLNQQAADGAAELANYFKPSVSRAYGEGFGNSAILPDYFLKLYTAD